MPGQQGLHTAKAVVISASKCLCIHCCSFFVFYSSSPHLTPTPTTCLNRQQEQKPSLRACCFQRTSSYLQRQRRNMLLQSRTGCDLLARTKSNRTRSRLAAAPRGCNDRSIRWNGIYPAAPGARQHRTSNWRLASPLLPHNRAASTDTMVTPEAPASNQLQQTDVLIVGGAMTASLDCACVLATCDGYTTAHQACELLQRPSCCLQSAIHLQSCTPPSTHSLTCAPDLCLLLHTGGPAGLASAIMFAKRGCKVTVAERNSEVTYSDPDRSYVYAIDGRGRQFTDKYDITPKLADASVDALDVSVTRVFPSGKAVTTRQVIKDERRLVYWLPRSRYVPWREGAVRQHTLV